MSRENVYFLLWILSWVILLLSGSVLLGLGLRILNLLFSFGWNLL